MIPAHEAAGRQRPPRGRQATWLRAGLAVQWRQLTTQPGIGLYGAVPSWRRAIDILSLNAALVEQAAAASTRLRLQAERLAKAVSVFR